MISLFSILENFSLSPKAIFLAGPAGSGKSYMSREILPQDFTVINVDDEYENLLKKQGLGLNIKDFTSTQLSKAGEIMGKAQKLTRDKYEKALKTKFNLIIDGTGASSKVLLKKKKTLEDLGYDTLMLMLYVSPLVSLERNKNRERSLLPSIILRTWRDVNKNVNIYQKEFGKDFILINNNPQENIKKFSKQTIQPYFDDSKAKGKEKTPEEKLKSKQNKEQIYNDINSLLKSLPKFDSKEEAKSKITKFLSI